MFPLLLLDSNNILITVFMSCLLFSVYCNLWRNGAIIVFTCGMKEKIVEEIVVMKIISLG